MMMKRKRFVSVVIIISALTGNMVSQSLGERLFKENVPEQAAQVLENEITNGTVSENSYNFLGLAYYQLGEFEKSVKAFQRGIAVQPENVKILSFNQGNAYFALKDYTSAVSCYSKALESDPDFYEALLNRANSLLMGDMLRASRDDYALYLEKNPENPQKNQIEQLLQAIDEEIARREEEERLLREQEKARWELVDENVEEVFYGADGELWEKVEDDFEEGVYLTNQKKWESFEEESIRKLAENEAGAENTANWEAVSGDKGLEKLDAYTAAQDKTEWESIDDDEAAHKKRLDDLANSLQNTVIKQDD